MRSSWLLLVGVCGCDLNDPVGLSGSRSSARELRIETGIVETGIPDDTGLPDTGALGDDDDETGTLDTGSTVPTGDTGDPGDDDDDDTGTASTGDTGDSGDSGGSGETGDTAPPEETGETGLPPETGETGDTAVKTYEEECEDAGIELPPKFTDWKLVGVVKTPVQGGDKVELWTWTKGKTYCAALPRYVDDGTGKQKIDALGMICMDEADGDTCFWDNVDDMGNKLPIDPAYDIYTALGGDELDQNCTSCHRGHNPWVQNNEAPLDSMPQPPGNVWQPVSPQAGWEGWDPATSPRGITCSKGCHEAAGDENNPTLTREYCVVALDMERVGLMARGGGWAAFKARCDVLLGP
jgi:hypothetical protein